MNTDEKVSHQVKMLRVRILVHSRGRGKTLKLIGKTKYFKLAKEPVRKFLAEKSGIKISRDSLVCKVSGYG